MRSSSFEEYEWSSQIPFGAQGAGPAVVPFVNFGHAATSPILVPLASVDLTFRTIFRADASCCTSVCMILHVHHSAQDAGQFAATNRTREPPAALPH